MGIRAASILFSLMGHAAVIYVVAPFFVSAPQSLPSKQTPLNITVTQATGSTEISQKFQPQPDITVTSAKVVPLKIAHIQKEKQIQTSPKISRQSSLPPKPVVKKAPTQIATKPSHTTPASLQTTKQPQVVASPKPIVKNTPIQVAEVPPKQSQTISSQSVPKPETIPVKSVIPQGKITPKTVRTRQNTLAILEIESSYTSDLLKAIGSYKRILAAEMEDLARVPGIGPALARSIYDQLHEQKDTKNGA